MQRTLLGALALALVALTAACGPKPGGKPPVSSPVYQFQAPDDDAFDQDSDDDDDDSGSAGDTSGDEE